MKQKTSKQMSSEEALEMQREIEYREWCYFGADSGPKKTCRSTSYFVVETASRCIERVRRLIIPKANGGFQVGSTPT